MQRFIGIDGGGSNLRVVITDENMTELVRVRRSAVNPNTVGREQSALRIQDAIREALSETNLETVDAVGMGIAGASAVYAEDWLRDTIRAVLPDSFVAPASDNEIALVGGTGERYGLLLLSGTGSVGFGMNRAGEKLQVGGWGYILGDEGSGYWIGLQALKTLIYYKDRGESLSPLAEKVDTYLKAESALHLVEWVYIQQENPIPVIAKIASLVLDAASNHDEEACNIVASAVTAISDLHGILIRRLNLDNPPIVFAGGLLSSENAMSLAVARKLGLTALPQAKYEPVIGAALLGKLSLEEQFLIG